MKAPLRVSCLALVALWASPAYAAELPPAPAPVRIADHVVRSTIDGIDVIACPTGATDVISFHGSLPAGDRFAPAGNRAIATLVGAMLDKGTLMRDKFVLANALDSVGASISFTTGSSTLEFSGKCLRKDLTLVIDLLAEEDDPVPQQPLEKLVAERLDGTIGHGRPHDGRHVHWGIRGHCVLLV